MLFFSRFNTFKFLWIQLGCDTPSRKILPVSFFRAASLKYHVHYVLSLSINKLVISTFIHCIYHSSIGL